MTRPDRRMVDVELVEDRPDEPGAASVERPPTTGPARSRPSRRWAPSAVSVLVIGVVLAWSVRAETAEERADAALLAAFADVTGIASSLREPLTEHWADAAHAREVAGRSAHCPASVADGTLLVCQVFGEPGQGGPTTDAVLGGTPDRLVVLAADDGRVVAERELGTTTIGWAVLDDDVVLATRVGPRADVERSGVLDGQIRWRTRVPLPPAVLARQMQLTADTFVVLSGPAAGVLDAGTGDLLGTWTASTAGPVQVATSTIGFAVWTSPREGIWFDRDGAAGARLPGAPVVPAVDDGSLPGVVLLQDTDVLRAVDVHAGILWEGPRVRRAPVRLDGVVVLEDDDGLRATDLASGAERWSVGAATASLGGTVVTDGVRLLTVSRDAAPDQALRAVDLRDGSLAWTAPMPVARP
jgi:outer membrane protein assembly factor BamB